MLLRRVVLWVLLSLVAAAQSALAQTSGPAQTAAAQDLAEQLAAQVPKWFEALGAEGRVPRVFTGITRDARQLIVELDDLPFDHVKRRDFLIWLSWRQSLMAYAYATRVLTVRSADRPDPVEQLVIYASSFEMDVVASFNLVRKPGGAVEYGRESHVSERAKEQPDQPFWGLHRGLRSDRFVASDEFEKVFAALEAKVFLRQVRKPAEAKADGGPLDLIERALNEYVAGNYEVALRLAGEAADHLAKRDGQASRDFASALNIQALSHKRLQRVKEAEALYRRAIDIYERLAGHSDKELAVALDNLASLYVDEARFSEAEALRLRALQVFKATLEPSSASIGTTLQNLGVLYQQQGRLMQARDRFLEALPIIEKAFGAESYLTVSEIATLKLNADWVILSACNTAGSSGESSAALSGMGRAFIYAGSRALLASHWEVGSDAAVKLVTRAVTELKSSPQIGRAEALQRSMRHLIENGDIADAHPAQWAPFVVVGEGAAELRSAVPAPRPPKSSRPSRTSRATAKPKTASEPNVPTWQQELWRR